MCCRVYCCLFVCCFLWLFACVFVCLFVCLFVVIVIVLLCFYGFSIVVVCLFACLFVGLLVCYFAVCWLFCLFVCLFVCLVSVKLAWILRHGAVTRGLYIDSEGYILVDAILDELNISNAKLRDIVAACPKRRYEITEINQQSYIRAR